MSNGPIATARTENGTAFFALASILLYFSFVAVLYHYVLLGSYLGQEWPAASLGEAPGTWGNDLTRLLGASSGFDPYRHLRTFVPAEPAPYPPLAFAVYGALAQLGLAGALGLFYGAFVVGLAAILWSQLARFPASQRALLCVGFLFGPFPVLYMMDRGNLDGWAFLLVWLAVLPRLVSTRRAEFMAPVLIGLASALKIYPMFYLLIYLKQRQFQQILIAIAALALSTLLAALLLYDGVLDQLKGFAAELKRTEFCYSQSLSCENLSLVYPFKVVLGKLGVEAATHAAAVNTGYQIFCLALCLMTAAFVYVARPASPLTITFATCLALWLPAMSFQYKLLFVLIAIFALIREKRPWFNLIAIVLAFALIPKRHLSNDYFAYGPIDNIFIGTAFFLAAATALRSPSIEPSIAHDIERALTAGSAIALTAAFSMFYLVFAAQALSVRPLAELQAEFSMSLSEKPNVFGAGWGGFYANERTTFRWTEGCVAKLNVRLLPDRDYKVSFEMWTHDQNPSQVVSAFLNNAQLGHRGLPVGGAQRLEFDIPRDAVMRTKIVPDRLTIQTSECNRQDDGPAGQLGVAVAKVVIAQPN